MAHSPSRIFFQNKFTFSRPRANFREIPKIESKSSSYLQIFLVISNSTARRYPHAPTHRTQSFAHRHSLGNHSLLVTHSALSFSPGLYRNAKQPQRTPQNPAPRTAIPHSPTYSPTPLTQIIFSPDWGCGRRPAPSWPRSHSSLHARCLTLSRSCLPRSRPAHRPALSLRSPQEDFITHAQFLLRFLDFF